MCLSGSQHLGSRISPTRNLARALVVALVAIFGLGACDGSHGSAAPATSQLELTILHVNDHHSNLEAKTKTVLLNDAEGVARQVSVHTGGFARVVSAFAELAQGREHVLKLHAGDALTGTLYFNRAGELGEADAALMNLVCFDAFTLGNHEFDKGDSSLAGWLSLLHSGECRTPILSANVRFGESSALHPSHTPVPVMPYTVVKRSGQNIGIVGLTTAEKTKVSSSPDRDTQFEDEAVAAQRAIDALKQQGIDKIIVLSHIGYDQDKRLITRLTGVDVVVGGDSHSLLGPETLATYGVGDPVGPYPVTLRNADGDVVCLVQAWEYAQVVGELRVHFDEAGRVLACEGTPHLLVGADFILDARAAGPTDAAAFRKDMERSGFLRTTLPDDKAIEVLQPYKESVQVYKETVVAAAPQELCSRRVPGGPGTPDYGRSSPACNARGSVSIRGGDIQQLVAQAYVEVADSNYGGADISLQSGGGVRIPLQGSITAANILELLPFDGKLWRLELSAAELRQVVEEGLEAVLGPNASSGAYPYTGGLRWDVDTTKPKGARASNFEYFHRPSNTWLPLDDAKYYRLFTLTFNATGGDGYETLAKVPPHRRMDVGVLDVDVFLTYIESLPKGADGLPILQPLDASYYSTKSFKY